MGDDLLTLRSLKGFADGSIGSSTALFFTPYADDPKNLGLPSDHAHQLLEWALAADRAGLQLSIHAIGDRAIYDVLDIFERVKRANGPRDRRPRVEHDQHPDARDIARHVALGAIASVQPYHAIDDGRFVEARIGRSRSLSTYAFRSFQDAGVRMGFGSDWTVAPLDPILGIDAAVNRRTLDGKNPGGWFPEQKLSVAEAIRAYTLDNAYAAFWDDRTGSLTPGKYADVIILDRDLLRVPQGEIAERARGRHDPGRPRSVRAPALAGAAPPPCPERSANGRRGLRRRPETPWEGQISLDHVPRRGSSRDSASESSR